MIEYCTWNGYIWVFAGPFHGQYIPCNKIQFLNASKFEIVMLTMNIKLVDQYMICTLKNKREREK